MVLAVNVILICFWGIALLFLPILLTVLADHRFSPDEAHWADYASSPFMAQGLYARTWLQEPMPISPGLGWSVAGYGWVLENVAFNIQLGRLWNFAFYWLAFAGVAAVTWRLYGRQAAFFSAAFAVLSQAFIPLLDYRPDHQLPAAAMLITLAALQARYARRGRLLWHFLCGLLFLLRRRLVVDRLLPGILVCILLSILALDSQGYTTHFSAFYAVPMSALLVDGLASPGLPRGKNRHSLWCAAALFLMLSAQAAGELVAWPKVSQWLRTGALPPTLYEAIKPSVTPFIRHDEVVVSTHQLIWTIPDIPTSSALAQNSPP